MYSQQHKLTETGSRDAATMQYIRHHFVHLLIVSGAQPLWPIAGARLASRAVWRLLKCTLSGILHRIRPPSSQWSGALCGASSALCRTAVASRSPLMSPAASASLAGERWC